MRERRELERIGAQLYAATVAQARQPVFFAEWGVADRPLGRFAMVIEHVTLVLARLGREGEAGRRLGEAVTAAFVADMDDAMRKIGIGDLGVPRRVKKAAAALFDRHTAYLEMQRDGSDAARRRWRDGLSASLMEAQCPAFDAATFDAYVAKVEEALAGQAFAALRAGTIAFPDPKRS